MAIQFRYYKAGNSGFYESPGKLILSGRKAHFPDDTTGPSDSEFLYSPVSSWVEIPDTDNRKHRQEVNILFTEQGYRVGQREVLAYLGWFQKQKLMWMYRDHWLQRPGNLLHTIFILFLSVLALAGILYLEKNMIF